MAITTTTDRDLPAFAALDTAGLSIVELAELLRHHGSAHLSPIERIELAERLTRRRFIIGASALALGTITGCGPQEQAAAPTATSGGYPRTVRHYGGETVLPARPERVVSAHSNIELDTLLALGITPISRGAWPNDGYDQLGPWTGAAQQLSTPIAPVDLGSSGWNLEALTTLQPDVVFLTGYAGAEEYTKLGQVAPAIMLPPGDIPAQLRITAEVFAIEAARVDALLADIDATYAAFRSPRVPQSIVLFDYYGGDNLLIWTTASAASTVIERLGLPALTAPPVTESQVRKDFVEVSLEQINLLEADLLLVSTYTNDDPVIAEFETRSIFQNLGAVQAGNYHRLTPDDTWALHRMSPLTPPFAVKVFERVLQG